VWEAHVEPGKARTFLNTTACMQPCQVSGEFDTELRERFRQQRLTKIAELYPSGRILPIKQTRHIAANTMRIGPWTVDGQPTYGLFLRDLNSYFSRLGIVGDTYGQGGGLFNDEPLLVETRNHLQNASDAITVRWDVTKESIDCATFAMMVYGGVLVTHREAWLRIDNITSATAVIKGQSDVVVDGTPLYT